MSQDGRPRFKIDIDRLREFHYDDVTLHLESPYLHSGTKKLGFEYKILVNNTPVGVLTASINDDFTANQLEGNIGVMLERHYYAKGIPEKAVRATFPLFNYFNQDNVIITFENENGSVKQVCEALSGKYLDTITRENSKPKIRYIINCRQ